ncbi:MMPL family transporter [Streptomyces sp. NPDC047990]|uniref:MMPL family transporter n=1 Tax=Streptomyces sp. NPDC047990 TaxID=3365496 RepID=UPI0037109765
MLFRGLPSNRSLAPAGALAMGCCVLAALTFVPCAALLGSKAGLGSRKHGASRSNGRVWSFAASVVDRHTRAVWLLGLGALAGCTALAVFLAPGGLPLDRALAPQSPSVRAQSALSAHFADVVGTAVSEWQQSTRRGLCLRLTVSARSSDASMS